MDLIHFIALNIVKALNEINKSDQRLEINKDYNIPDYYIWILCNLSWRFLFLNLYLSLIHWIISLRNEDYHEDFASRRWAFKLLYKDRDTKKKRTIDHIYLLFATGH